MIPITTASRDDILDATSLGNLSLWGGIEIREELILPDQFFSPVRFQEKYRGEIALRHAILGDAIRCFLGERWERWQNRTQIAQEAETWLFSDDTAWPFSFMNICELLDLNPTSLRAHLRRWQQSSPSSQSRPLYVDYQEFLDGGQRHAIPSRRLPRFRKRCQPVQPLHGKK